jgi:hypothetical protein
MGGLWFMGLWGHTYAIDFVLGAACAPDLIGLVNAALPHHAYTLIAMQAGVGQPSRGDF